MTTPKLRPLHANANLIPMKLDIFRRLQTAVIVRSLAPEMPGSLKVRPDGTILDGHHRIAVLRERNIDTDSLPREVFPREGDEGSEAR